MLKREPPVSFNWCHEARVALNTKGKIIVLADSQEKELETHLRDLEKDFQIFVYSASGAKLKNVIQNGLKLLEGFTDQDFVILLAVSNDAHKYKPIQLTISQGLKSLFSIKVKTNILINSIPYYHDDTSLNNREF